MKKGFTLLELLVVVLILGILVGIAIPQYKKAVAKAHAVQFVQVVDSARKARELYFLSGDTKEGKTFYDTGWNMEDGTVGAAYVNNLDELGVDFPDLKELEEKYKVRFMIHTFENDPGFMFQIEATSNEEGFMFEDVELSSGYKMCAGGREIGKALERIYHCGE